MVSLSFLLLYKNEPSLGFDGDNHLSLRLSSYLFTSVDLSPSCWQLWILLLLFPFIYLSIYLSPILNLKLNALLDPISVATFSSATLFLAAAVGSGWIAVALLYFCCWKSDASFLDACNVCIFFIQVLFHSDKLETEFKDGG